MEKTAARNGGKRNATSFSKENPRPGPGRGHKKALIEAGEQVIADMERGYSTPESKDDSPAVKRYRKLAHEDTIKFTQMWLKVKEMIGHKDMPVEKELTAAATAEAGPKEETVEGLAKRLLAEWENEEADAKGDTELAVGMQGQAACE